MDPRAAPLRWPVGKYGDLVESGGRAAPHLRRNPLRVHRAFSFTTDKARRELGYTIGPLDHAIVDAITWFRTHGMLKN